MMCACACGTAPTDNPHSPLTAPLLRCLAHPSLLKVSRVSAAAAGFSSIEDVGDDTLVTGDYADKAEERWREQVQAAEQQKEPGQSAERGKEGSSSYGSIEEIGDNRLVSGSYGEDMEKRWQKGEVERGEQQEGEQQKSSEDK